jgi:ribosomal protein S12 methylthiotransferase accessory factor
LRRTHASRLAWDATTPFRWLRGVSLVTGTACWVPLQTVSGIAVEDEPGLRPRVTTGVAAHPDRSTAILNGLLEVIERDAFMLTWLSHRAPRRIALADVEDAGVRALVARLSAAHLVPRAALLSTDSGIPVVLASLRDVSGVGPAVAVGAGANPSALRALSAALTEAMSCWAWIRRLVAGGLVAPDDPEALTLESRVVWWATGDRWKGLEWLWDEAPGPLPADAPAGRPLLSHLVEHLAGAGEDILVVDLTDDAQVVRTGLHVVAVVVPGYHPMHLNECHPAFWSPRLLRMLPAGCRPSADPHPFG